MVYRRHWFFAVILLVACGNTEPVTDSPAFNFRVAYENGATDLLRGDSLSWFFNIRTFAGFTQKRALRMEFYAPTAPDSLRAPVTFFFDGGGAPFGDTLVHGGTYNVTGSGPDPVVYITALTSGWSAVAMTGTITVTETPAKTLTGQLEIGMDRYHGVNKIDTIHVNGTFVVPHSSLPDAPL